MSSPIAWVCLAIAVHAESGAAEGTRKPYKGIFRINTDISAGSVSPEEVVRQARDCGAKVLVFSDQFLTRAEWGMWPVRNLLKFSRERKSVSTYGLRGYIERIEKLDRDNPDMVIVAGLDVAPHYYWEGFPLGGGFTVHQWSEQMTLAPVSADEPFSAMPVVANPQAERRWGWGSVLLAWPVLLVAAGGEAFRRGMMTYRDEQGTTYRIISRRRKTLSAVLIVFGVLLLINNAPFSLPTKYSQYQKGGFTVYQGFIDWIGQNTSAQVFWSAPEIAMREEMSGVKLMTEPYVDHVVRTTGATGFASIYGDARTMHLPGKEWDQVLQEYCKGEREQPLWAVGERDYHGDGPIDMIQTVFLLPELSREAVLREGLRGGKMYAVCRSAPKAMMTLDHFSVSPADGPCRASMEDLDLDAGGVKVCVVVKATGKRRKAGPLRVCLVRNGEEIKEKGVDVPLGDNETQHTFTFDDQPPPVGKSYYRILAHWLSGELVSNPIFVSRTSGKDPHG